MKKYSMKKKQLINNINSDVILTNYINNSFLHLMKNQNRYLMLYGGAGSGKSMFAAQKIIYRILSERNHRFLILRKVARTIRNSQFSLLKKLTQDRDTYDLFEVRDSDMKISSEKYKSEIISAGLDDREKLKSINGVTGIWIEEATELDRDDFLQIDLRLRGKTKNYKQIICTYNPVNAHHWLNKINLNDSCFHKSTYRENKFIDENYKSILEDLKNQNEQYYKIYSLGEWGTLDNSVYKPFEIFSSYPQNFDEEIFGLDFGYNNPCAFISIGIKDTLCYLDEVIYENKLTNSELINKIKLYFEKRGMEKSLKEKYPVIYADSAEPNRIAEFTNAGLNIHPADKSVKDGIDFLKTLKIYSKKSNENINREVLNYSYKKDKNGIILDEPMKSDDHAMDAIRYALYTHKKKFRFTKNSVFVNYSLSF